MGEIKTDLTLSEIEGKIADAELAIHKIGAVNMLAIEEYETIQRQVQERTERKTRSPGNGRTSSSVSRNTSR